MTEVTRFPIAERFQSPQGEGLFAGQQMAFIRLVGCSVGQGVCHACDTDFSRMQASLGGGMYSPEELLDWASPCRHVCLTGGEPLDRDIRPVLFAAWQRGLAVHVETSGTKWPRWFEPRQAGTHGIEDVDGNGNEWTEVSDRDMWLTVSPKPGYLRDMVEAADEVKVIIGGLGDGPGWPTVEDALRWADAGKLVYIQPRNQRTTVDRQALDEALLLVEANPVLRLSVQLHKFIERR